MSACLSVTALVLLSVALLAAALVPSALELCRPSDVSPLNVVQQHAGEATYFASSFRAYVRSIEPILEHCFITGTTATGVMPDGVDYIVLGRGEDALLLPLADPDKSCAVVLSASTTLLLPPNITFLREIYAKGSFIGGSNCTYRAILAEKQAHLSAGSRVLRWVHAHGELTAGPECQLFGRISSDCSVRVSAKSKFIRLNAPKIEVGLLPDMPVDRLPAKGAALPLHRTLHHGDLTISAGEIVRTNLVVRGNLRLRENVQIYGSVKCENNLLIENNAVVSGSVISERGMRIGSNCLLGGPVIAERRLLLGRGTLCGAFESPTTVSAPYILAQEGIIVFGTLWAREEGKVVAAS
jgi:hypothetical protein